MISWFLTLFCLFTTRTIILVILFLFAFTWVSVLLILILGARLNVSVLLFESYI